MCCACEIEMTSWFVFWPITKIYTELHIYNYSKIPSHWKDPKHFQSTTFWITKYPIYGYHLWRISYSLFVNFKLLVYLTCSCLFIGWSGILFTKGGTASAMFYWNLQVHAQWICHERTWPDLEYTPTSHYLQESCSLGSSWTPNTKTIVLNTHGHSLLWYSGSMKKR